MHRNAVSASPQAPRGSNHAVNNPHRQRQFNSFALPGPVITIGAVGTHPMIETSVTGLGGAAAFAATRRYAWYVVSLLTLTQIVSYVDRFLPSLLIPSIKEDLGL